MPRPAGETPGVWPAVKAASMAWTSATTSCVNEMAGGSHAENRLNDLQESSSCPFWSATRKPVEAALERSFRNRLARDLPYGEIYAAFACVWEGVEAPPEAVTTTGTRAAIVCEIAAASALAITGVSDVNRFATLR